MAESNPNTPKKKRRKIRHGRFYTPEYKAWANMVARCTLQSADPHGNYRQRGITVCERWRIFGNFYADMGDKPTSQHSLDRINNNGNYEPENCRWATRKEQQCNTRHNHYLTYQGKTLRLTEWAEHIGMTVHALSNRINIYKWSIERALTQPLKYRPKGLCSKK